jgi:hypothetical protein
VSDVPSVTLGAAPARRPLIAELELLSAARSAVIERFYGEALGLPVEAEAPGRLTVHAGATRIRFVEVEGPARPFYHFAFDIPENKLLAARTWLRKRVDLLPIPERQRDPAYPDDVVDYRHWNAHSLFFFDPAGNVVELIARHDAPTAAPGSFASADILYATEIALVVDDVPAGLAALQHELGLPQYRGASDEFAALGDECGLVLLMRPGRHVSFDAPERKAMAVFPTRITLRSGGRGLTLPGCPYEILTMG